MRGVVSVLALGVALGACATAPQPTAEVALPVQWQTAADPSVEAPDAYWQVVSTDPVLQQLLDEAGAISDVQIAAARLREAEALGRAARASLFPQGSATAGLQSSAGDRGVGVTTASGEAAITAPIDLFGATRTRAQSAAARVRSAEAELGNARLIARRTTGQLYAALRSAQAGRAAAERQVRNTEDSLSLARARADAGLETGLAVAQAQAAADAARARIPVFAQAETQARLGIEALLGRPPADLVTTLAAAPATTLDTDRLLGTPAAVIARRPDVRAAEARLAAAGLDARAARADRWPTASLALSLSATDPSRGVSSQFGSAGLSLAGVLFDFGRLDALADAAGARAEAEAAQYQRTVLNALSEVEQQADRLQRAREEATAARAAVASAQDQVILARVRYTSGLANFLDVLVAERALADADSALAAVEGRLTDAGVSLAAALGLGQGAP